MENYQLELEDKKYLQYKNNKTFHIGLKDSGKKLKKEEALNSINKLKKNEEIKNGINGTEERLIRNDIEKYIIEKKEKINLKEEENIKLELNNEIQINNIKGNKNNINTRSEKRREEKRREEKKLFQGRRRK